MKRFLLKSAFYGIIAFSIISAFMLIWGRYIDYFYLKFTTPKYKSFIIGDSRSFQGIQPEQIINFSKTESFDQPFYNYSFTIGQFSYDSINFRSIKRKFDSTTSNGLFLFSINPWVLSEPVEGMDSYYDKIKDQPPHNMQFINMNPNYEYLLRNFLTFNFKGIFRKNSILHNTGWLENGALPQTALEYNSLLQGQYKMYFEYSQNYKHSPQKIAYLQKMIKYFNNKGKVFLIRMPVHNNIRSLEEQYWPEFDSLINETVKNQIVQYLNFSKDSLKYQTYDGNHMDKSGGKLFSKDLASKITFR